MAQKRPPLWLDAILRMSAKPATTKKSLSTPGLPVDAADATMLQTAVRLTRDLAQKLPELEAQNKTLADVVAKLTASWRERPTSVLGTDDPKDLLVSTHVTQEVESAADLDLGVSMQTVKRSAIFVTEAPTNGPKGESWFVPVNNLCLNDRPETPVVEHNNYLIWALLLVETTLSTPLSVERHHRGTTLPVQANSASEFRSMLGTAPAGKPPAGSISIYWKSGEQGTLVLQTDDGSTEQLQLKGHIALEKDPVKLFAVVDLYLRNITSVSKPTNSLNSFATELETFFDKIEGQSLYHGYACVYNTLTNENAINAALESRNRPRPVAHQGKASAWHQRAFESTRLQRTTFLGSRCVGYLPSSVNLIATPTKLQVPEQRAILGAAQRALLFLEFSAMEPFVDQMAVVVLEVDEVSVLHVLGHIPVWFGAAHTDCLLSWLGVSGEVRVSLRNLGPIDFLAAVEALTGGSHVSVDDAVASVRGQRIGKNETVRTEELDFAWSAFPLLGRQAVQLESGERAAEDVEPVFSKSGALAKFKRDVSAIFDFEASG